MSWRHNFKKFPEEIHETGLKEVKRLREGMSKVSVQLGFGGLEVRSHFKNTSFSSKLTNWPNKLDCSITQLERLSSKKHSNLFGQIQSYEENEVLRICIQVLCSKHFIFFEAYKLAQ